MRTRLALALGVAALGWATLAPAGPATAQVATDDAAAGTVVSEAARELAARHVPVMMLQEQPEPCSGDGEPFLPMPVEAVLDNPEIALRQAGDDGLVVTWAPSAADLHAFGPSFFLDFPGSALAPGCGYERDMDRYMEGLRPTVYAHIATQPDAPGVIALQYWFYWYYNDWNNKHESDWEGIQLLFRADSIEEALTVAPESVGYAQHTGGERAGWDDDKLERDGERPVVYTSARSHASYYGADFYLGRGASEGFGCDDTTGPSVRVDPDVVVLPALVTDPQDPLAWLEFPGRWGERHGGAYDAPTGLQAKARWNAPVDWHERLRDGSVTVPSGGGAAAEVVDAFCEVVRWGSGQALLVQLSPLRVIVSLVVLAAAVRFLLGRTAWSAVAPRPIVARRRAGQLGRAAFARFRAAPLTYVSIGAVAIPVIALAGAAFGVASRLPWLGDLLDLADTGGGSRVVVSAVTGGVVTTIAMSFVVAAAGFVMEREDTGAPTPARLAIESIRPRVRALLVVAVVPVALLALLSSTVLLAPIAFVFVVRWQLAAQAVAIEGAGGRSAMHRSARLTRGRWWHTLLVTSVVNVAVIGAGLVVALLAITVASSLPLWSTTVVVAVVGALVMPLGAIVLVLLYGDARADADGRDPAAVEASAAEAPVAV